MPKITTLHLKCFLSWKPWTHNLGVGHPLLSKSLGGHSGVRDTLHPDIVDTPSSKVPCTNWASGEYRGRRNISTSHIKQDWLWSKILNVLNKRVPSFCHFSANFYKKQTLLRYIHAIVNLIIFFCFCFFPVSLGKSNFTNPSFVCWLPHFPPIAQQPILINSDEHKRTLIIHLCEED